MFSVIYDLVVRPLEFAYDLIFALLYRVCLNPAFSIISLSLVINTLVLPLYKKADALQKEEQAKKQTMGPWVRHIRKNFSGSEQFMMLSAYYKVERYSPINFLKEAVPLLLQIPFFMAAYRFISSLELLAGASFWQIEDLSQPDGLLAVGGVTVNLLPILMTAINLISGAIYSKGSTLRLKGQILITALIFLVLLYNSPSGLVIYWTMNNLYSLGKNLVLGFSKRVRRFFKVFVVFLLIIQTEWLTIFTRIRLDIAALILAIELIYIFSILLQERTGAFIKKHFQRREDPKAGRAVFFVFFFSALALTVLLGLYIPSTVIVSSVLEFMNTADGSLDGSLLTYPASIYGGLLLIWLPVAYFSSGNTTRRTFAAVLSAALIFSLLNQFVFFKSFGTLYTNLKFDGTVLFSTSLILLNLAVGLFVLGGCAYLIYRNPPLLRNAAAILAIALLSLSVKNIVMIRRSAENRESTRVKSGAVSYDGMFRLSRTSKNVIVFMLDRAIGEYVPFIFDEKPELLQRYDGFVFYPDTLSFGNHTNFGAPGIFGGYEYTPAEINKRTTESLAEKHDQALLLMPLLFSQQNYDVTICDPPYAGYKEPSDLSIYDDYPGLNAYRLTGMLSEDYSTQQNAERYQRKQQRNFVMYGLYRTAPLYLRNAVYDDGNYLHNDYQNVFSKELTDSYAVLSALPKLTAADDEDRGSFLLLQNTTPHNPAALTPPDYLVETAPASADPTGKARHADKVLDGKVMSLREETYWEHYCINVATYQTLANWLDSLKAQGVYDNTRIIFVADHGYMLDQFEYLRHPDGLDIEGWNPLLMVKDFDAHGPLTVCQDFMTNADVPTLAMEGIIENPVNPFTGNPVTNEAKNGVLYITDSHIWEIDKNNGVAFDTQDGGWWSVHDSIYDMDNWKRVEEEEVIR